MSETSPEIWGPVVAVIVIIVIFMGLCWMYHRDEIMPAATFVNYQPIKWHGQRRRPSHRVSPAWHLNDTDTPRTPRLPQRPEPVFNPPFRELPARRGIRTADGGPSAFHCGNRQRAGLFAGRTGQIAFLEREVHGGRWQAVVLERQPGGHL